MSFFATGNRGIESTTIGIQTVLSSASLLAEVDVNGTNASLYPGGQAWGVIWIVGTPATAATFLLDHALSTGVESTGIVNQTVVSLSSGQTGQYFTKHNLETSQAGLQGHRFRVRLASSIVSAHAKIIAEPLV
jgi:hypothetical protein